MTVFKEASAKTDVQQLSLKIFPVVKFSVTANIASYRLKKTNKRATKLSVVVKQQDEGR